MLKAIAVQECFEWVHKPVVIPSDDLVTLDAWTLTTIKDKI
jgi:hypothetical protein